MIVIDSCVLSMSDGLLVWLQYVWYVAKRVVITAIKLYALVPWRSRFWEITQSPFLQPLVL